MRDGLDFDDRYCRYGYAVVAGKFRHRLAGVRILILADADIGQDFSFDHHLRIGDGEALHRDAVDQFHGSLADAAGDRQFIEANRRGGRLKTSCNVNNWIDTNAYRDRKRLV